MPAATRLPARKTIASVDRALRLLEIVADAPDGLTPQVIARRVGANLSTTYHLLHTLADRNLLVRLPESRGCGIGYGAVDLHNALARQLSVTPEIADVVRRVHGDARAAACFAVFREGQIVIAHVVDSRAHPMPVPMGVGFDAAPHATAFGKLMLAHMGARERAAVLGSGALEPFTDRTICDPAQLQQQLASIVTSGIALELEEFRPDVSCLAAPVRRADGTVVGAIAIAARSGAMLQRRWAIERVVRVGAHRASRAMAVEEDG